MGQIKDLPRLKCVLFQLPPNFNKTEENMERLVDLKRILPKGVDIAVEFRNKSWLEESTYDMFAEFGWAVVGTVIFKRTLPVG